MHEKNSMSSYFVDLIVQNPALDLGKSLFKICSKFNFVNATYFGTGILGLPLGEHILLTTYPKAWINHYFEQGYEHLDPIIFAGNKSILPMDWSTIEVKKYHSKKFFGEAAEFGLGRNGLTISVRGIHGDHSLFSVNTHTEVQEWIRKDTRVFSDLTYFAHLLHQQVINKHAPALSIIEITLSQREKEVLRWAALGKTAWETSQIINLAEKTVSFYISNACTKLKVATKTQAVAKVILERSIIV